MNISVIGAGAMGGAFVDGMLKGEMFQASDITVANPTETKLERFAMKGASVTTDNKVAATSSDIVSIFVKPWLLEQVIEEIKEELDYGKQTLIICAAGIKASQIKTWLDKGDNALPAFFLVIPNTAIAVKASMTFIVPVGASTDEIRTVSRIFDELGKSIITEERLLGAGTTLASCGIAYAMRYIRAASEGGVELGFRAADAQRIVQQTVKGAVELLQANGTHPEQEIDKVTTPGGLTIKGLNEMEHAGFTSAVVRGLKAGL